MKARGNPWAKRPHPRGKLGKPSWNSGKTEADDIRISIIAQKCSLKLTGRKGRKQSEESRLKISETMKNKGLGGLRLKSGRGKKGRYKGYWCDSTWELAYVIYNLEHDIAFERNYEFFEYEFNGKRRKYYPDFRLSDGSYVEIKGYYTDCVRAKIQQFPKDKSLIVYDKEDIKIYLSYVEQKYGKNFHTLYENGRNPAR